MEMIKNSICAPKGFTASGIHCGIRLNKNKKDLALIVSDTICNASAVYTTNLVQGAPIIVTKNNLKNGKAQAMICNSGIANTCNADGIEVATQMCELVEKHTNIKANDVIVASTGVIGKPLPIQIIASGMEKLVSKLDNNANNTAQAIMTTDTHSKEIAINFEIGGVNCCIGGIAKGSGMINPNMATMLVFLTTDVAISTEMLDIALKQTTNDTFNMISVDGDTSTNDMVSILANGKAGNKEITAKDEDFTKFAEALFFIMEKLSKEIAKDGEGATKLITCTTTNAPTKEIARKVAKSVISSSLLKAAMFGADANWGRVLCAIGYSGVQVDINKIDVAFASKQGEILVCKNGKGVDFSEKIAKKILLENEVIIKVNHNSGNFEATAWGCDLTYDYVKINGDYRS
ncbi:MAG: bifunctional glutamate N-acetyltransferase/amino-acid acetyltransferase ArgJ [Clostridia bacterium]